MELSIEQKYALELFKKGENIFITGPGGTGKTKLIEHFVEYCANYKRNLQVCALTGCATLLLPKMCNARTIHSWSGIRLCKGENEKIIELALKGKKTRSNWKSAQILIVDEVSMMSQKVFDVLNELGKRIRYNSKPFGGLQVVFLGDFYQLPPVANMGDIASEKFCFESIHWKSTFPLKSVVVLSKIFRQVDPKYKEILLQIRNGYLSKVNAQLLSGYVNRSYDPSDFNGCVPTKLFPTRAKTDQLNASRFAMINQPIVQFKYYKKTNCKTYLETNQPLNLQHIQKCTNLHESVKEYEIRQLLTTASYSELLELKIGAIVMCTVNLDMDNGICNGSQGVITGFAVSSNVPLPEVTFVNGIKKVIGLHYVQSEEYPSIAVGQIPLCLAWALTIHKIQGATLQMADIDVGNQIFECGQTYVALSRVESLDGLYLSAFNAGRIKINPIVKAFYECIPEKDYKIETSDLKYDDLEEEPYCDPTIKKIVL